MKEKIKVVTYLRVACGEQVAIFRKNEELRELLEQHKDEWEVVDTVFDYGMGGRKLDRPGLHHVLELCKDKQVDMVVTLQPYMIARDVLLYKNVYTTIRDCGVELFIDALKKQPKKAKPNNYPRNFLGDSCFATV